MNIFHDKQQRNLFLTLGLMLLLGLSLLFLWNHMQRRAFCQFLHARDNAAVTVLLSEGVPEEVCARALTGGKTSAQSEALLSKLGLTMDGGALYADIRVSSDGVAAWTLSDLLHPSLAATVVSFSLMSALLLLAVSLFLHRRERLCEEAVRIVTQFTGGDFSQLLPQAETGGLSELFARVNTMATALQAGQETEKTTKDFLKNTISDISHQLKTPLAALSMYNEIMTAEPDQPDIIESFLAKSETALHRMEHLIQTLLKLTRLDAGGIAFHMEETPVDNLVRESVETLTERARREQKALIISGSENCTLRCDREWTREAIENIVKNALDHTKPGGCVTVSWENTPTMTRLSVTDDGEGISNEDIHHIFKRFYRSPGSADAQGVGLGLPLAKSIVEEQGGIITVESRPGEGSRFLLSFPSAFAAFATASPL